MSKKNEPYCKNCGLFDKANSLCKVIILHEGEKINLPVEEQDACFFQNQFTAITPEGNRETFKVGVEEIKAWVEDPKTGEKCENGIVKIEFPDSLECHND